MDFDTKLHQKDVDILKAKLRTYGKLRSKKIVLEWRLNEILTAMNNQEDNPKKAAQELGIHALDESHPAEQRMIIEKTTVERELQNVQTEMAYLGVDEFLNSLRFNEYQLIELVYILGMSYEEAGVKMNITSSGVYKRIKKIFSVL